MDKSQYFQNKNPIIREIYEDLLAKLKNVCKDFKLEYKNTSIHVVAKSAFLGIHFMAKGLKLNIVLDRHLDSKRIFKVEQVSKNRFHNEVKIDSVEAIDEELLGWIREAYLQKN